MTRLERLAPLTPVSLAAVVTIGLAAAGCAPSNTATNIENAADVSSGGVASAASALAQSASPSDAGAMPTAASSHAAPRSTTPAAAGGYD